MGFKGGRAAIDGLARKDAPHHGYEGRDRLAGIAGVGCGLAIPVVPGGALSAAVTTMGVRSNVVTSAAPKTAIRTAAKIRTGASAKVCGLRGSFSMLRTPRDSPEVTRVACSGFRRSANGLPGQ